MIELIKILILGVISLASLVGFFSFLHMMLDRHPLQGSALVKERARLRTLGKPVPKMSYFYPKDATPLFLASLLILFIFIPIYFV